MKVKEPSRIRRLLVVGALAGSSLIASGGPLGSLAAATLPSMSISGTVYDSTGAVVTGADVQLTAQDNTNTVIPTGTMKLLETSTDSSGNFMLDTTGCCTGQSSTLSGIAALHGGDVTLEILAITPSDDLIVSDFSASLITVSPNEPILTPHSGVKAQTGIKLQAGRGLVQTVATTLNPGPFPADDPNPYIGEPDGDFATYDGEGEYEDDVDAADPAYDEQLDGVYAYCVGELQGSLFWDLPETPVRSRHYVPVQYLSTRLRSSAHYEMSNSVKTQFGQAITGQYGAYGGGLSHSTTEEHDFQINTTPIRDYTKKAELLWWWFTRRHAWCGTDDHQFGQYLNAWKWVPDEWAHGSAYGSTSKYWDCGAQHWAQYNGSLTVAKSSTELWQGGFHVAGVGLNSEQTNSSTEKITYAPHSPYASEWLCGSNKNPIDARFVREIEIP